MSFLRSLLVLSAALALASCGGSATGGNGIVGGSGSPSPVIVPPTPAKALNVATVTLDAGPAALSAGSNGYSAFNEPYVTITICVPGSTTVCQTIDHIILDTGSVGVRLIGGVLKASLLAGLPAEVDQSSNPVGQCYQYVNSYAFGSVRKVDFAIAGETVASMPVQVIADAGVFSAVPASCSSGGGTNIVTAQEFGANGIIGIGTTTTDCGTICTTSGGSSGAIYYDCPTTGCSAIIARAANAISPFEQLINPVAGFAADNNGTILALPAVPAQGAPALSGTVTFGIGTQSNNALNAATVLPVTTSGSRLGAGVLTVTYKGKALTQSFFDSGSNEYFFIDPSLPPCTSANYVAFYCPTSATTISYVVTATNGATANEAFSLASPLNISGSSVVAPGLAINPTLVKPPLPFANSFDTGLPFFLGRTIYTAIEGRQAAATAGPFVAY